MLLPCTPEKDQGHRTKSYYARCTGNRRVAPSQPRRSSQWLRVYSLKMLQTKLSATKRTCLTTSLEPPLKTTGILSYTTRIHPAVAHAVHLVWDMERDISRMVSVLSRWVIIRKTSLNGLSYSRLACFMNCFCIILLPQVCQIWYRTHMQSKQVLTSSACRCTRSAALLRRTVWPGMRFHMGISFISTAHQG